MYTGEHYTTTTQKQTPVLVSYVTSYYQGADNWAYRFLGINVVNVFIIITTVLVSSLMETLTLYLWFI